MVKNIFELSAVDNHRSEWAGKKTVLVGGCFDVLHYGHLTFLTKAKEVGDILIVALESDEFVTAKKKRKSIHTQQQRAEILTALEVVDYVVKLPHLGSDADYQAMVKTISPDIVAITENDPYQDRKKQQTEAAGGTLVAVCAPLSSFSTSSIVNYENLSRD